MFLNSFAETAAPLELASTEEFQSLLASAADLGIPHARDTRGTRRVISCCGGCASITWSGARRTLRRSCCCMAVTNRRIPGTWSACTLRNATGFWR